MIEHLSIYLPTYHTIYLPTFSMYWARSCWRRDLFMRYHTFKMSKSYPQSSKSFSPPDDVMR